jgi:NAD(P)-dependent dehydrogenase (short-subunit alcohol dehydrogenase family)
MRWLAYGQSKLANLLFTFELQRRLERMRRTELIAVASHPGYASTNLLVSGPQVDAPRLFERMFNIGDRVLAQSADRGALPSLYGATAPDVRGGEFFGPNGIGEMTGWPKRTKALAHAYDRGTAERLWQVSVEHTGVDFDALTRT